MKAVRGCTPGSIRTVKSQQAGEQSTLQKNILWFIGMGFLSGASLGLETVCNYKQLVSSVNFTSV